MGIEIKPRKMLNARVLVVMDDGLRARVEAEAEKYSTTMSDYIRQVLENVLPKEPSK